MEDVRVLSVDACFLELLKSDSFINVPNDDLALATTSQKNVLNFRMRGKSKSEELKLLSASIVL